MLRYTSAASRAHVSTHTLFCIRHNMLRYKSAASTDHVSAQSHTYLHQAQLAEVHKSS